jgi:hypothetical protein
VASPWRGGRRINKANFVVDHPPVVPGRRRRGHRVIFSGGGHKWHFCGRYLFACPHFKHFS